MQSPIRGCSSAVARITCLVCFACLAVLPTASAQCKQKYTNLTTCSFLNGVSASGDITNMQNTQLMQMELKKNYDGDIDIKTKTEACWLSYLELMCVALPTYVVNKDSGYSAPCASDGTILRPCNGMCVNFYKKCSEMNDLDIGNKCTALADKPNADKCYGSAGVLGMKNSASSATASFAIVPLALAVARLGMSSSF